MASHSDSIKRVPVPDMRLGMHLHALDGPWLKHPFWKTRFVLDDPHDLQALQASGITHCWIDVSKGVDVEAQPPAAEPSNIAKLPAAASAPQATPAAAAAPDPAASASMADELERAARLVRGARAAVAAMFSDARLGKAVDATQCLPLVNDITASVFRNPGALVSLSRLKTQDDYSYMHSVAVCALMVSLARSLGFAEEPCRQAGLAGLLHDVGKATMPLEVLNKPGKLTDREFAIIRTHPQRGHALLLDGQGAGAAALDVCLHHHEKMDGSGYPWQLAGESISLLSRMGAVCDVYDAVTSNRPYKTAWDPAAAIAQMASWTGHFDPAVFRVFVKSLGIYPVGSLVRLASGRLAVVTEHNPQALTSPTVRAFFSTKSNLPVPPLRIDLSRNDCADRIVARESRDAWGFPQLDTLWAGEAVLRGR